ncbi:hypothetical protein DYBT9623_00001 [Dyadobacter sp. CECT 9623]|uniref:Endonuclease GajA/Old nuclease/RecF-like AAA domain-containing protein n=1 Tax=Dyadobacter linearis TaxID=2823330 RepID=A0ABN7QZ78_9BACT|nr:AAA family ATPase [Dyadobacter sp. CECT 9623]CAG5067281.1 hypothetical protein DYBT9623_00001 [Dyadobacter sp. CECT 9623]
MRLKSFRIQNYKSIIDSGECRLSENDGITVLAGQNESGKSSILQAIRDFENETIDLDSVREDDSTPTITCVYCDIVEDTKRFRAMDNDDLTSNIWNYYLNLGELRLTKKLGEKTKLVSSIEIMAADKIMEIIQNVNGESKIWNEKVKKGEIDKDEIEIFDVDDTLQEIIKVLVSLTPYNLFFDDFCDILPNKILLSEFKSGGSSTKGYQAVKNVETILGADFIKLDSLSDGRRETTQTSYHETLTAEFNEKWKQRIGEGAGAKVHVKYYRDESGASYLKFYVETKKGEYLPVEKRSQGFKWFLSFYLQLKAENKGERKLIILFDEPGMYLHSKAQSDMIKVFEELSHKNQIIYSTHSPYLIDTSKLHRVRLVLNTKDNGTTAEKITSGKINNQLESLKPIIDAIGLEVAMPFSVAKWIFLSKVLHDSSEMTPIIPAQSTPPI